MDDESCYSMEPMEEVPLIRPGESELEKLVSLGYQGFKLSWSPLRNY